MEEEYTKHKRKQIDDDVTWRLDKYRSSLSNTEYESLVNDCFASCYIAEQIGFHMGVKFMKRL